MPEESARQDLGPARTQTEEGPCANPRTPLRTPWAWAHPDRPFPRGVPKAWVRRARSRPGARVGFDWRPLPPPTPEARRRRKLVRRLQAYLRAQGTTGGLLRGAPLGRVLRTFPAKRRFAVAETLRRLHERGEIYLRDNSRVALVNG